MHKVIHFNNKHDLRNFACLCLCVWGQGGGLPGNMLGDGKTQMKKKFLSS